MRYCRGLSGFQVMVFWGERALNYRAKKVDLNPISAILSVGDYGKVCNLFIIKWS